MTHALKRQPTARLRGRVAAWLAVLCCASGCVRVVVPQQHADGEICSGDSNCNSGHCSEGVCCASNCDVTESCAMADTRGTCKARSLGDTCTTDAECPNQGHCADGVCCNNACNGFCESCNQPIYKGQCTRFADNTDPERECGADNCSACFRGACLFARGGTDPKAHCGAGMACAAGGLCAAAALASCSGPGTCSTGQCVNRVCEPLQNHDVPGLNPRSHNVFPLRTALNEDGFVLLLREVEYTFSLLVDDQGCVYQETFLSSDIVHLRSETAQQVFLHRVTDFLGDASVDVVATGGLVAVFLNGISGDCEGPGRCGLVMEWFTSTLDHLATETVTSESTFRNTPTHAAVDNAGNLAVTRATGNGNPRDLELFQRTALPGAAPVWKKTKVITEDSAYNQNTLEFVGSQPVVVGAAHGDAALSGEHAVYGALVRQDGAVEVDQTATPCRVVGINTLPVPAARQVMVALTCVGPVFVATFNLDAAPGARFSPWSQVHFNPSLSQSGTVGTLVMLPQGTPAIAFLDGSLGMAWQDGDNWSRASVAADDLGGAGGSVEAASDGKREVLAWNAGQYDALGNMCSVGEVNYFTSRTRVTTLGTQP